MKKVGGFIRDCVEKYIPAIAFVVLFVVFVFQVFMRYAAKNPQAADRTCSSSNCGITERRSIRKDTSFFKLF